MTDLAGLAILHALIAAALIEALLRVWRVGRPGERIALRWLALLAPLTLTPAYALLVPGRSAPSFRLEWALFSGSHWDVVGLAGVPASQAATALLAAAGFALFIRDAAPWLANRVRLDPERSGDDDYASRLGRLERTAATAAGRLGVEVPRLRLVGSDVPVLLCTGVERPTIEVSRRTLDLLDDDGLHSALLHEMVHVRHRDPLHGWLLIATRTLQLFNPVAHVISRLIVRDLEERADLLVSRLGGGNGLAQAISRLSDSDEHGISDLAARPGWRTTLARAQERAAAERCDRVRRDADATTTAPAALRFTLASLGLASLLFFVV